MPIDTLVHGAQVVLPYGGGVQRLDLGNRHEGLMSEENPLRRLVCISTGADVETVMINGKVLIEDGQPQFSVEPEMPSIVRIAKAQIWKDLQKGRNS
jgi:hypothetical protein